MMYVLLCLPKLISTIELFGITLVFPEKWNKKKISKLLALFFFQVLAGCISGPMKLVSEVRNLHHVLGGTLNPVGNFFVSGQALLHF